MPCSLDTGSENETASQKTHVERTRCAEAKHASVKMSCGIQ